MTTLRDDEIFEGLSSILARTADINRWALRIAETKRISPDRKSDVKHAAQHIADIIERLGNES